jgi:hypothetical protein
VKATHNLQEPQDLATSNLIKTDWDGTIQNSYKQYNDQALDEFGPFNMDLVRYLNAQRIQGKEIAIVTAGKIPAYALCFLHKLLGYSGKDAFEKQKNKQAAEHILRGKVGTGNTKQIEEYIANAKEVYELLQNSHHFYKVRKNPSIRPEIRDEYKGQYFNVDSVKSTSVRDVLVGDIQKTNLLPEANGVLLTKLIKDNPGKIPLFSNDDSDQRLACQLKEIFKESSQTTDFEVIDAAMRGCGRFDRRMNYPELNLGMYIEREARAEAAKLKIAGATTPTPVEPQKKEHRPRWLRELLFSCTPFGTKAANEKKRKETTTLAAPLFT